MGFLQQALGSLALISTNIDCRPSLGCHKFWKMAYFGGKMRFYVGFIIKYHIFNKNGSFLCARDVRICLFLLGTEPCGAQNLKSP